MVFGGNKEALKKEVGRTWINQVRPRRHTHSTPRNFHAHVVANWFPWTTLTPTDALKSSSTRPGNLRAPPPRRMGIIRARIGVATRKIQFTRVLLWLVASLLFSCFLTLIVPASCLLLNWVRVFLFLKHPIHSFFIIEYSINRTPLHCMGFYCCFCAFSLFVPFCRIKQGCFALWLLCVL